MTNSIIRFDGDFGHLQNIASVTPIPGFSGTWSTVELQPDAFSPQSFSVGIVVQSPGDRLHFRLLDDLKKFDCVYQNEFPVSMIREIMAYAEDTLRKGVQSRAHISDVIFETSCLSLSSPKYTSGDDREATVERLFNEIVVMAVREKHKGQIFESVDTMTARRLVNEELKRIAVLDYEKIVNPNLQGILYDDKGGKHFLDLNLVTKRACGSVTSAAYKAPQTVELNLLKASHDLTTYSRIRDLNSIGLFLFMPEVSALDPKDYKRIEDMIGEHEWKLERSGFHVVSLSSPSQLAQEIYDWARPTLV